MVHCSNLCINNFEIWFFTAEDPAAGLEAVTNGEFGEVQAPVFIDGVACTGNEMNISNCARSRIGFITDACAQDIAEDFGVRCPGTLFTEKQALG